MCKHNLRIVRVKGRLMSWDPHPGLSSQAGSRSATKSMTTGTTLRHNTSPNLKDDSLSQPEEAHLPKLVDYFQWITHSFIVEIIYNAFASAASC